MNAVCLQLIALGMGMGAPHDLDTFEGLRTHLANMFERRLSLPTITFDFSVKSAAFPKHPRYLDSYNLNGHGTICLQNEKSFLDFKGSVGTESEGRTLECIGCGRDGYRLFWTSAFAEKKGFQRCTEFAPYDGEKTNYLPVGIRFLGYRMGDYFAHVHQTGPPEFFPRNDLQKPTVYDYRTSTTDNAIECSFFLDAALKRKLTFVLSKSQGYEITQVVYADEKYRQQLSCQLESTSESPPKWFPVVVDFQASYRGEVYQNQTIAISNLHFSPQSVRQRVRGFEDLDLPSVVFCKPIDGKWMYWTGTALEEIPDPKVESPARSPLAIRPLLLVSSILFAICFVMVYLRHYRQLRNRPVQKF
jgi:hypothetical protein